MNEFLKRVISSERPKLEIKPHDSEVYKSGLTLLAEVVSNDFFDIPRMGLKHKYETDGFFYELPVYDSDMLYFDGRSYMLVVVYSIKQKSSFCPLRIDLMTSDNGHGIYVINQSGNIPSRIALFATENGDSYTQIDGYDRLKLSELLKLQK